MPWRLIQFIILFILFILFAAFNLGDANKSDISFAFTTIKDVPVFMTAFISFAVGMLCALPFIIKARIKGKKGPAEKGADKKPAKPREKKKIEPFDPIGDSSFSDGGPYGVN